MRSTHQQLTLWHGTPDAPAPVDDSLQARHNVSVTVAVQPPSPSNVVTVRYRVDDRPVQTLRAARTHTDVVHGIEYHRVVFPRFWSGERVTYLPILSCAGRVAPDPRTMATLPSSFRLGPTPLSDPDERRGSSPEQQPEGSALAAGRMTFSLEYLGSVRIPLQQPEIVGETPDGLLVNWHWYPGEGVVAGPKLNAKVRPLGGDWMTIRRDGIGVMDVRATLETRDGALLYVSYPGYYDLGERGYQDFLDGRWPERGQTRTSPQFHASDPRYVWLNRLRCLGIGEVRMKEMAYVYDLYAVR